MANKVVIGILIFLVIIAGGIGYFSYYLYQQVDLLNEQLAVFENEQSDRIRALGDKFSEELQTDLGTLEKQVSEIPKDIDALDRELGAAQAGISGLKEEINTVASQFDTLDVRIGEAEASISSTIINTSEIYDRVIEATVRITDGQSLIGSGYIMNIEGNVITAHHVIEGLSPIFVMMYDGRISRATVVGSCSFSDVAVLRLHDNPAIEPPPFGDSGLIRIGEPVVAIGSPGESGDPLDLGLRDTITSGIISHVNRFVDVDGKTIPNLLQFDAAVNFGNSGCALVNAGGEVIGLVIARIDPIAGDGIYWAVAGNKVIRVAESILSTGSFNYPWVGVGISDLTPEFVEAEFLDTYNGTRVGEVFSGGPAEAAGILTGDIIVSTDGVPVRDSADLTSYLGEFKSPGDQMTIEVIRQGEIIELLVEIGTRQ